MSKAPLRRARVRESMCRCKMHPWRRGDAAVVKCCTCVAPRFVAVRIVAPARGPERRGCYVVDRGVMLQRCSGDAHPAFRFRNEYLHLPTCDEVSP